MGHEAEIEKLKAFIASLESDMAEGSVPPDCGAKEILDRMRALLKEVQDDDMKADCARELEEMGIISPKERVKVLKKILAKYRRKMNKTPPSKTDSADWWKHQK